MDPESYLLKLISSRPYTRKELAKKLEGLQKCDSEEIQFLLDQYEKYGYINDLAYAKLYVASHDQWGKLKLADKMQQKGIKSEIIDIALDLPDFDETQRAMDIAQDMLRNGDPVKRIYSRLFSRGFTSGSVREGIGKAIESSRYEEI